MPTRVRASGAGIIFSSTSIGLILSVLINKIDMQV